jgi:hypothetical protein
VCFNLLDTAKKYANLILQQSLSVHSVQFQFMGAPKARCSPEPRMCEPLLLANPDTNTLRPVRSRASTRAKEPVRPHAYLWHTLQYEDASPPVLSGKHDCQGVARPHEHLLLRFFVGQLPGPRGWLRDLELFSSVTALRILESSFLRGVADVVRYAYKFGGWFPADSAG